MPAPTLPDDTMFFAGIGVTLREDSVAPAPAVGRAGRVTCNVHNGGAVPHADFRVSG